MQPALVRGVIVAALNRFLLELDRTASDRLLARLDAAHDRARQTGPVVQSYGLTFVRDPQKYTYFNNSNHRTAAWLRELGCEVRGPALALRWRVER